MRTSPASRRGRARRIGTALAACWAYASRMPGRRLLLSSALALGLAAASPAAGPNSDLTSERVAFAAALGEFRSGDDRALSRLVESAERMAELGRGDARGLVAFYRGLAPAARREGLAAFARYQTLRAEVAAAASAPHSDWPARRAQIQAELRTLIDEQRGAPDPAPLASALALTAILDEQRARHDPSSSQAERSDLLKRAAAASRESLALFARASFVTPTLEPLWLLARVDDAQGHAAGARDGFTDCLELAEQVESTEFRSRSLRGLITVAENVGDLAEQRERLRELTLIREPKDDWWVARRWAALLLADDEPEACMRFLSANRPSDEDMNQWHFLYGGSLQRLGRVEEAEEHFREVRLRPRQESGTTCAEVDAAMLSAKAALDRGRPADALRLTEPLDASQCTPAARAQRAYTMGAARLALGDAAGAEEALRLALEQGLAVEARLDRSSSGAVFGEVVGLESVALLAEALIRQDRSLEAVCIAEEVQARSLRDKSDLHITPDDVRAWAAHFQRGFLTWIVGADTTICAHVAADGNVLAIAIPLRREVLQDAMRRVREAAIAGDEARALELTRDIESVVVPEPLRIRVAGTGRILVLAHGPLERMPFDLMTIAAAGPLAVLPGLATSRPGNATAVGELAQWSVFGDPTATDGHGILPGARVEADSVARMVDAQARTGDAFDRDALLDALRSGRPLHIATHVVPGSGNGSHEAGFALARGAVFGAREIREVAPRLPLAVLAACATADGRFVDAQALGSISNAFLASGTRNLCVTLWPVEDGAARRWSEALHRELAQGAQPSMAVLRAREALRRDGTPVSEWAAFRFVGRD